MSTMWRSRWAAVGAAVAVSLGAGGLGLVHATTSTGEMPIYKPINPCRLADTRTAPFTVGPRTTPLGAAESYTLSGWGAVGQCNLPNNTAGLALNVTALNQTAATFLTLHPTGEALPNASHLNPTPGEPPTPNAVNVDLNGSGQFNVYNQFGNVDIIIDVVGFYDDHVHDSTDLTNEAGISSNFQGTAAGLTGTAEAVVGTSIRVPSNGFVVVNVSGIWNNASAGNDEAECSIQKGTEVAPAEGFPGLVQLHDRNAAAAAYTSFSAHAVLPISSADNPLLITGGQLINFVCREITGIVAVDELHISALFVPTEYEPAGFVLPFPDTVEPAPEASET